MNFKWEKKYLYWGVTAFCVITACVLLAAALTNFDSVVKFFGSVVDVFTPFIYGFAFAYLLSPIMNFFEKKCFRALFMKIAEKRTGKNTADEETAEDFDKSKEFKIKKASRILGVISTMLITAAFIFGVVISILPQLVETITGIVNNSSTYLRQANIWVSDTLKGFPEAEEAVTDIITNFTAYITEFLRTGILPQVSDIVNFVSGGIINVIGALLNVVLGFIICIYLLYNKELFAAQGKKVLYGMFSPAGANLVLRNIRQVHKSFGGFFTGTVIDAIFVGMTFFIILTVFDFPYALLISVILGITNVIPYFGPFIGAIPSALLILLVDPVKCFYFIIIVLIVQQFDGNIIAPYIIGDNTGLSSFWVIFALIVGESVFGFVGLIISIPLFAVAYSIIKARISRRLKRKGLPHDTNIYRDIGYIDKESRQIVTLKQLKAEDEAQKAEKKEIKVKLKSKKR